MPAFLPFLAPFVPAAFAAVRVGWMAFRATRGGRVLATGVRLAASPMGRLSAAGASGLYGAYPTVMQQYEAYGTDFRKWNIAAVLADGGYSAAVTYVMVLPPMRLWKEVGIQFLTAVVGGALREMTYTRFDMGMAWDNLTEGLTTGSGSAVVSTTIQVPAIWVRKQLERRGGKVLFKFLDKVGMPIKGNVDNFASSWVGILVDKQLGAEQEFIVRDILGIDSTGRRTDAQPSQAGQESIILTQNPDLAVDGGGVFVDPRRQVELFGAHQDTYLLERFLKEKGFSTGPVDGVRDVNTVKALQAYLKRNHDPAVRPTGRWDARTEAGYIHMLAGPLKASAKGPFEQRFLDRAANRRREMAAKNPQRFALLGVDPARVPH